MVKTIMKALLVTFCSFVLYLPMGFSEKNENTVIINNESTQAIKAPALIPSESMKVRDIRRQQEFKTEDKILRELERQRLLDEQKRGDQLLGRDQTASSFVAVKPPVVSSSNDSWFFGRKAFLSLGAGTVSYPGVTNINSQEDPAFFFSFGAYGYKGHLIFDLSLYYSKHYLKTTNTTYQDVREVVNQPALSMSVKYSFLSGAMKPYVGTSASLIYRKWDFANKLGEPIEQNPELQQLVKDVGDKKWNQAFDAGLAVGADIALGSHLGLNVDMRYHVNLYTENRKTLIQNLTDETILDERNSLILSGNLRYYF